MAKVNLLELQPNKIVRGTEGKCIEIFGGSNLGKTYQSSRFKNSLILAVEEGCNALPGVKKVSIETFNDFIDITNQLTKKQTLEQMRELYSTIVVDRTELLFDLAEQHILSKHGIESLGEKAYGSAYGELKKLFHKYIFKLTKSGFTIVFLSHQEQVEKVDVETGESYLQYVPVGSEKENRTKIVRDLADFVFYLKSNGVNKDTGEIIPSTAYCYETKEFFSRSRFEMPFRIHPFTAENVEKEVALAVKRQEDKYSAISLSFDEVVENNNMNKKSLNKDEWLELIKPYVTTLFNSGLTDEVSKLVSENLGIAKVSEAKEYQLMELENLYVQLQELAEERRIVVE